MISTSKKILFVEDEPVAQSVYRNRLQRDGFETLFAPDGAGALSSLSQDRPDLLVLDLMVPKANGADVLRHVRSAENLKKIPVLVLSNDYVSELSRQAMESGATRGMLKTECTPGRLAETIRDMLGFRSAFDLSDKPAEDESQTEMFKAAVREAHADEMMLKETREEFLSKAQAEVGQIRELCLAYIKAGAVPEGEREQLDQLFQQARFFSTRAGLSGCVRIALLASAFEALLFEIVCRPDRATPSTPQTIAQAVDSLERLCQKTGGGTEPNLKAKILVVDDDAVSNQAMAAALKRGHFEPVSLEDPSKALQTAQATTYDIVLLDINMPGINGFDLCEKLRALPKYAETPILFVSGNGDLQDRARGILSGGNDLIQKPISPAELVLKTTLRLMQPQGLWPEPAGATAVPPVAPQNHSSDEKPAEPDAVPSTTIPLKMASPTTTEPPRTESSFSTEMIKKAWSSGRIEPTTTENKEPRHETKPVEAKGVETKNPAPEIKEEPGKIEMTGLEGLKESFPTEIIRLIKEDPIESARVKEQANLVQAKSESVSPEVKDTTPEPLPPVPAADAPKTLNEESTLPPKPETNEVPSIMDTNTKPAGDDVARGVAGIIFGDENLTDMNVRLTRIALERYNVAGTQNFNDAARGIAQIIFGDDKISDMNVRLTRIALEKYKITDVLHLQNGAAKPGENGSPKN